MATGSDRNRATTTTADPATTKSSTESTDSPKIGPARMPARAASMELMIQVTREVYLGLMPRVDANTLRSTTARVMRPMRVLVMMVHTAPMATAVTMSTAIWSLVSVPVVRKWYTCGGSGPMPGTL